MKFNLNYRTGRRVFVSFFFIGLFAVLAIIGLNTEAATFPGTNTGAIPDGLTGTPPQYGAPRVINFNVNGFGAPISSVALDVTVNHTWVGDVDMVLRSPGGTASHVIVSRIGVTTAGSFGDSSNYAGTYTFTDTSATNIWTVATTSCGDGCNIAVGSYRTTAPGMTGQTNPAPFTNMTAAFSGLTTAEINGVWTLSIRDAANADTGTVTAANLTLIVPTAAGASVSGRVVTPDGRGVSRVKVSILNITTNETLTTLSSSLGYFSFNDLPVGNSYVLTVENSKYLFASNTQTFTLNGDLADIEFVAEIP
jgi:subtilisin-like proprotein convertase family protein